MPPLTDIVIAVLLVTGAGFALIGSLGLARLSDFYRRMHGPTKATTLGVGCTLVASSLFFSLRGPALSLHEVLVAVFLFLTAPVSAHLLMRAALAVERRRTPAEEPAAGSAGPTR